MFNQAPENYDCVFCKIIQGIENEKIATTQSDIVYRDQSVIAWISSHQLPANPGRVLIVPIKHIENIYDLPDDLSMNVHRLERLIATAMMTVYENCKGTASRLHNGWVPQKTGSGFGQDIFHYHLHLMPRYEDDALYGYKEVLKLFASDERAKYAQKLKNTLRQSE